MSRNALAFIAGLGTGYLNQSDKNKQQERQDKRDARDDERYEFEKGERTEAKAKKQALADAYKSTSVNESAVTLDVSGKPVLYEDAGVANSDYRQARNMAQNTGIPVTPAIVDPGTAPPSAPTPPQAPAFSAPKQTFAAGGIAYQDRAGAQAGADAYNAPAEKVKRGVAALHGTGDYQGAMQLETGARQAKLADIQLSQAEKAQVHDAAFREITEKFSRQGWSSVPEIYKNYNDGNTATVAQDGKGGAVVSIFNAKGEQVGQKSFANEMDFITGAVAKLDPKLWVSMKAQQADNAQTQGNWQAGHELAVETKDEAKRHNLAAEGISRGNAAAARNPGLRKLEETETLLGRKLTQPERERLAGIGKDDDKADWTFATNVAIEAVKAGTIAPDKAAGVRQETFNTISGGKQMEKIRQAASRAKADGKMPEFVAEMRKAGRSDADILAVGGEVQKDAAPASKPPSRPNAASTSNINAAPVPPIEAQRMAEAKALNQGAILDFSPEVKAYMAAKKAEQEAGTKAQSDQYRQKELQRSLAVTKGIN